MVRKVFLSFSGTLRLMRDGEVSDDDLARGLFYFGCARVRVMEDDPEGLWEVSEAFSADLERGKETHTRLRQALTTAEAEGRVAWRPLDGSNSQEQLSKLLVANGAKPLPPNFPPIYEYSSIATAIRGANIKRGRSLLEPVY